MSLRIDNVFFRKHPEIFICGCRYLQLKKINYVYTAAHCSGTIMSIRHHLLDKPLMTPLDKTRFVLASKDLPRQRYLKANLDHRVAKKTELSRLWSSNYNGQELIDRMYQAVVGLGHLKSQETFRGLIDTKAEKLTIHTSLWELIERDHVLCVNQPEASRKVSTKPIRKIRSCNT